MKVKSLSRVRPFVTLWTVAYQAPPSMGFYKALGIIAGFWQKAMELKSLRMVFLKKILTEDSLSTSLGS